MAITVSTSAALMSALKAAHAGDTILLAPGVYSTVAINNLNFASNVTIASASDTAPATLTGLTVSNSSGLAFRDLDFSVNPSGGANQFLVSSSRNIAFSGLDVHGNLDGNAQNDASGLELKYSSNITIEKSEFHELYYALGHRDITGLTIKDSNFHDLRMDGIRGAGSSNLEIAFNTFRNFNKLASDHSDAIQFWNVDTQSFVSNISIHDNMILRDDGTPMQGIFMNTDDGSRYYRNVTITDNLVIGASYHGISINGATGLTVEDNVVVGLSYQNAWIRIENVSGGSLSHNSANAVIVATKVSGVAVSDNGVLPLDTDEGAAIYAAWISAHTTAVAGGPIVGDSGANTLVGTAGADTIVGNGGRDLMTGGSGDDVYVVDGSATIVEAAHGGVDTVRVASSYVLGGNLENLELQGSANLVGKGNSDDNVLTGNAGMNALFGKGGDDTLVGNAGADSLYGAQGDDRLVGGSGADSFVFTKGDGHDTVADFGAGGEHDVIDLSSFYGVGLKAALSETAAGVTIAFTTGDTLLVAGAHLSSLHATATGYIF